MQRRTFLQLASLSSAFLAGCGSAGTLSPISSNQQIQSPLPAILSAEQAAALVNAGALLLACESRVESIPLPLLGGAITANIDQLTLLTETATGLTDLTGLGNFFAALGVESGRAVVCYDDGEAKFASRMRYLLSFCSATPSYLVNGGSPALASLLPLSGGSALASDFRAVRSQSPPQLIFQQDVAARLGSSIQLLDVRSPAEFSGRLLLPGDARPGHIPGARNLPVTDLFHSGLLLQGEALRQFWRNSQLSQDDDIIVYCHDGAKSSLAATLLVESGFTRVSLYYLSYRDWSQNPSLPVEV